MKDNTRSRTFMKSFKKFLLAAILFGMTIPAIPSFAVDNLDLSANNPPGYENLWNRMTRKLGRGVSNVAFGALELPLRIYAVNFEEGGISAWTFGLFSGIGYVVAREVVGVVEIITFPVPLPNCPNDMYDTGAGYGPILTPEWIISPSTNAYNFVYKNSVMMN